MFIFCQYHFHCVKCCVKSHAITVGQTSVLPTDAKARWRVHHTRLTLAARLALTGYHGLVGYCMQIIKTFIVQTELNYSDVNMSYLIKCSHEAQPGENTSFGFIENVHQKCTTPLIPLALARDLFLYVKNKQSMITQDQDKAQGCNVSRNTMEYSNLPPLVTTKVFLL